MEVGLDILCYYFKRSKWLLILVYFFRVEVAYL